MTKITIIDGHPDERRGHFIIALADAYAEGAAQAGHRVTRVNLSELDFPMLRSAARWADPVPPELKASQEKIGWAEHLVLLYPLWLGGMPAYLKGFLEQATCGGFAIAPQDNGRGWARKFKGKSARIIVTMGMPASLYRIWFGAHSLKSLERNILRFAGAAPVRDTIIGLVDALPAERRSRLLERVRKIGAAAR